MPYGEIHYPKTKRARERLFDKILDAGRAGKSHAQIAEMIGIGRQTLSTWIASHEELKRIMALADDYALAWWEALGQRHAETREGNAPMIIFVMKNRFGQDYDREADADASSPDENLILKSISVEARQKLRAILQAEAERIRDGSKIQKAGPKGPALT